MLSVIGKIVIRLLLGIFCLVAIYLLTAFALSIASTTPDKANGPQDQAIFIASNGVHLDIIIPKSAYPLQWSKELPLAKNSEYLSFGWGDKEFYLNTPRWKDLTMGTAFRAVFVNSEAALHITGHHKQRNHWIALSVCEDQLAIIINYINDTFEPNAQTQFVEISGSGYNSYDAFYEARGSFNLIQTCNHWVNKALKAAKIKTSVWSPFDFGVLRHIQKSTKD